MAIESELGKLSSLVSVIIPTYNRAFFIERAINSVLTQTVEDLEIIVVDDGSTDETRRIVSSLQSKDERVRCIRHEVSKGSMASRNTGIKAARGEIVGFLDSDDEYLPTFLEREIQAFSTANDRIGVVHCDCYVRIENTGEMRRFGVPKLKGDVYRQLLRGPGPMFQGMLVRREYFDEIGYLDDEHSSGFDEWEAAISLSKVCEFEFVDEPLFVYCRHDQPTISGDGTGGAAGYVRIVRKHLDEITEAWGPKVVANHFLVGARLAFEGGDRIFGRRLLRDALVHSRRPNVILKVLLLALSRRLFDSVVKVYVNAKGIGKG